MSEFPLLGDIKDVTIILREKKSGNRDSRGYQQIAGKEVLIKSVVQAIPVYALSCYKVPKKIFDRWNKVITSFWWNNAKDGRYIAWVDKFTLQNNKDEGGLGFKNFHLVNIALLLKQAWRILSNPDLLLSKIYKERYYRSTSFLEAQVKSQASWAWRSIQGAAQYINKWMYAGEGMQGQIYQIAGDGGFSTKSAYALLLQEENKKISDIRGETSDKQIGRKFRRRFWRLKVHNKAKIFMWRLYHDAVPVGMNLRRRGCLLDARCVLCGHKEETSTHIFLQCWWAKEVWKQLLVSPHFLDYSFTSIGDWVWFCIHELDGEEIIKVFCGVRWIWWNRNKLWHKEEGVDLQATVYQIFRSVKELSQVNHRFIISKPESGSRWEPLQEGEFKISCDGAWNPTTKEAGLGVVCRDCAGRVEFVAAAYLQNQTSITEVEGIAMQFGMRLARDRNMEKVTFDSDNIAVVQALLSQSKLAMRRWYWLAECNKMIEQNKHWFFEHVMREANQVADLLAHKAREEKWVWKLRDSVP